MLSLSPATRVFVAVSPVDMRRSFNGLYAHVQTVLREDPQSGHLFVFTNRLRNRVKVLFWDGSGLWVCAKRLEAGIFHFPGKETSSVEVEAAELALLLEGIDLADARRQRRYRRGVDLKAAGTIAS